ncbi:MAG: 2Fe-2S iron-sulfur cluster-binding protein [bacterium]
MNIRITINGRQRDCIIEPHDTLLEVLRRLDITSVRLGCDTASCSACSVLLDDKLVPSCAVLAARADGHRVTTVEGLPEEIIQLGQELVAEGADQCGFCGPALLLSVYAMEQELTRPTRDEINHYLTGNLCRCTGYAGQLRAIEKYLGRGAGKKRRASNPR